MSSSPKPQPEAPSTNGADPKPQPVSIYQEAVALIKRMEDNSPAYPKEYVHPLKDGKRNRKGFDPIPPDQITWALAKDRAPLNRVWAAMCVHTLHWGHRKEYAVTKEGHEMHIEHIASYLDMDDSGVYKAWREGVALGLWRNGTMREGKRRLYLLARVVPVQAEEKGEDKENPFLCTRLFSGSICKQLKDWPKSNREDVERRGAVQNEKHKAAFREATALLRDIREDDNDRFFASIQPPEGFPPLVEARQEHESKLSAEELEARRLRAERFRPRLEELVQTVSEYVQSQQDIVCKAPANLCAAPQPAPPESATLLGLENPQEKSVEGVRALPDVSPRPQETPHCDEQKRYGQEHTPKTANAQKATGQPQTRKPAQGDASDEKISAYLATHKPPDNRQAEILFSGIPELQKRWPRAAFAQKKFSHLGAGDKKLTSMILEALEGDDAGEFLESVERRCEAGEVQTVGLFLELAREFHRAAPDRARRKAEWDAEEARAAAFTETARKREEADDKRLREHPEECLFCKGTGLRNLSSEDGKRKWKGPCFCPAGEQAAAKTA
jgi:hypothetical protein